MPIIGMGAEYPQLMEVAERLNENVAQLHRSICLFMGQAWKKVSPHLTSQPYALVSASSATALWCFERDQWSYAMGSEVFGAHPGQGSAAYHAALSA